MRCLRPTAIIAAFLIIAVSIPQSMFSQEAPKPAPPKQPAPRQRQPKRPQRADALATAINELLKLDPLAPASHDYNSSDTSQDEEKPPDDDAPIKDLFEYWSEEHRAAMKSKVFFGSPLSALIADADMRQPSEKVGRRLLEVVEDRPWLANSLLEVLPATSDTHDRLYRLINQEPDNERNWKEEVRQWLSHNSNYFRDDLLAEVRSTFEGEGQNAMALKSLSKLDWDAARPFIETYAAGRDEILAPIALSLLIEHELKSGDAAKIEAYRARLKAMVTNRQAPADTRSMALTALMATKWSGREEWFVSLFADPSLSGLRDYERREPDGKGAAATANLLLMVRIEGQELIPEVSSLIGHANRNVHNAAIKWLAGVMVRSGDEKTRREAARHLLPWLTDPGWADEGDRASLIRGFAYLKLPESLAGLIWILEFDESADNRAAAAGALTRFGDPSANPALRRALNKEESEDRRADIIIALAECGGFSDDEMVAAIEAYVKASPDEESERDFDDERAVASEKPLPLKLSIGRVLIEGAIIELTEGLAVKLIDRAKALRATQPRVARKILSAIEGSSLRVAEINLVERIGAGWADVDSITLALETRDSLQKSAGAELYGLIKQGGYASGVAAAILNDEREWKAALEGADARAQLALLACAYYLSDKLPIELAGKLLGSPNRALAKAAEIYLVFEDSAAARKLILARHPGEAYILGDNSSVARYRPLPFGHNSSAAYLPNNSSGMKHWAEEMRRDVNGQNGALEVSALGRAYATKTFTGVVIRVRGGRAEISVYEDPAWESSRKLTPAELDELRIFTSRQEVEDLGPEKFIWDRKAPSVNHLSYEYLRLNKDGGRRIALHSVGGAPKNPTLHEELAGLFHKLSNSGAFKVRYAVEDRVPGLEVMWADKKQPVLTVCQEKGELRVMTGNGVAYLLKDGTAPALPEWLKGVIELAPPERFKVGAAPPLPEWRIFTSDGIGRAAPETPACRRSIRLTIGTPSRALFQTMGGFATNITLTKSESERVYAVSQGKDQGVWKAEPGGDPVKLLDDAYLSVFAMPDGKWLIGYKVINQEGKRSAQLVRHNLRTNEEFPIVLPRESNFVSFSFSEAHGKALIIDADATSTQTNGYLLDVETGAAQAVKGDFRPIVGDDIRRLQPSGRPDEFWASVFDDQKQATIIGRYDAKTFSFTPLIRVPELRLSNSDIWVDQMAGWLWIAYRGHLLRMPLPK